MTWYSSNPSCEISSFKAQTFCRAGTSKRSARLDLQNVFALWFLPCNSRRSFLFKTINFLQSKNFFIPLWSPVVIHVICLRLVFMELFWEQEKLVWRPKVSSIFRFSTNSSRMNVGGEKLNLTFTNANEWITMSCGDKKYVEWMVRSARRVLSSKNFELPQRDRDVVL